MCFRGKYIFQHNLHIVAAAKRRRIFGENEAQIVVSSASADVADIYSDHRVLQGNEEVETGVFTSGTDEHTQVNQIWRGLVLTHVFLFIFFSSFFYFFEWRLFLQNKEGSFLS